MPYTDKEGTGAPEAHLEVVGGLIERVYPVEDGGEGATETRVTKALSRRGEKEKTRVEKKRKQYLATGEKRKP